MLTHPHDSRLYLVEVGDIENGRVAHLGARDREALRTITDWAQAYLCNPHPELGRSGPVCPFTRPSIRKGLLFLTVYNGADIDEDEVADIAACYRDWFIELAGRGHDAQYCTINIIFPDIRESGWFSLIEGTQTRLKPSYVERGIMIGEFHPGPPTKPALWNPEFRALRAPLPLLSIRQMVPTDFEFLKERAEFMQAYLARYRDQVPAPMAVEVARVASKFGLA